MGTITEDIYSFRNPGDLALGVVDPVAVVSIPAMPAPKALITTVSSTGAVATIALPYPGFTGVVAYIPTGTFTGVTSGTGDGTNMPIGLAFTAVVGKVLELYFDGFKWYPSYVS